MPTYDYKCTKCSGAVELSIPMDEKLPTKHKKCGGKLVQVISAPTILYKGSGWARKETS